MPGRPWTTPDQRTFLESQVPAFLIAQTTHRLADFYIAVTHKFFTQWSERELRFPPEPGDTTRALTGREQLELSSFIIRRKEVRCDLYSTMKIHILTLILPQQIRAWFPWHAKTQARKKPTMSSLRTFALSNHEDPAHAANRGLLFALLRFQN
jgi:hypothetical protein